MNFAGFLEDDIADSFDGFCMSLWFNGCDIRCPGCHNKHLWDTKNIIDNALIKNKICLTYKESKERSVPKSLSILGGEPLAIDNRDDLYEIVKSVHIRHPDIVMRLWTGRTNEQLACLCEEEPKVAEILKLMKTIIVGPYVESLKDNKPYRGSSNQEILENGKDYEIKDGHYIYITHIELKAEATC